MSVVGFQSFPTFCNLLRRNLHNVACILLLRNDGSEFSGSIFQRVTDRLETALQVSWIPGTVGTRFAVGAKYCADRDTTFRVCISLL